MPATILSLLLIWASLIAQGEARPNLRAGSDQAIVLGRDLTIEATHLDGTLVWTSSEADTVEEQEDSSDDDGLASVAAWSFTPVRNHGHGLIIQVDGSIVRTSSRSPILRC